VKRPERLFKKRNREKEMVEVGFLTLSLGINDSGGRIVLTKEIGIIYRGS
jgi:hypothetical protein